MEGEGGGQRRRWDDGGQGAVDVLVGSGSPSFRVSFLSPRPPGCGLLTGLLSTPSFPGVNPQRYVDGFEWDEFKWRRGELAAQFEGKTVMVGVGVGREQRLEHRTCHTTEPATQPAISVVIFSPSLSLALLIFSLSIPPPSPFRLALTTWTCSRASS